eukprot:SAG22_NODE_596_length_8727_cov_107.360338_4_plen_323_part_00
MWPTMKVGTISAWNVEVGEEVGAGDVFALIETDKATVDFEYQEDGIVAKILVGAGEEVAVGTPVAIIVEDADDIAAFADFVPEFVPEDTTNPKADYKYGEGEESGGEPQPGHHELDESYAGRAAEQHSWHWEKLALEKQIRELESIGQARHKLNRQLREQESRLSQVEQRMLSVDRAAGAVEQFDRSLKRLQAEGVDISPATADQWQKMAKDAERAAVATEAMSRELRGTPIAEQHRWLEAVAAAEKVKEAEAAAKQAESEAHVEAARRDVELTKKLASTQLTAAPNKVQMSWAGSTPDIGIKPGSRCVLLHGVPRTQHKRK